MKEEHNSCISSRLPSLCSQTTAMLPGKNWTWDAKWNRQSESKNVLENERTNQTVMRNILVSMRVISMCLISLDSSNIKKNCFACTLSF